MVTLPKRFKDFIADCMRFSPSDEKLKIFLTYFVQKAKDFIENPINWPHLTLPLIRPELVTFVPSRVPLPAAPQMVEGLFQ